MRETHVPMEMPQMRNTAETLARFRIREAGRRLEGGFARCDTGLVMLIRLSGAGREVHSPSRALPTI